MTLASVSFINHTLLWDNGRETSNFISDKWKVNACVFKCSFVGFPCPLLKGEKISPDFSFRNKWGRSTVDFEYQSIRFNVLQTNNKHKLLLSWLCTNLSWIEINGCKQRAWYPPKVLRRKILTSHLYRSGIRLSARIAISSIQQTYIELLLCARPCTEMDKTHFLWYL